METAGGLSAKMFIDIAQAQQALQNINTLLKVSQKNFQELGKQGIYLANGEFKKFAVEGVAPLGRETEKLGNKVTSTTQEYRQFFREQRMQDRLMREGKEAIMGIAFAFMILSSSGNETSSTMKGVQKGLVGFIAGMNATEFTAFSLGRSLSKLQGGWGKFGEMLVKNSGLIGAVVGIGAGLIAFFSEANAEAKKAAEEGLDDFAKKLSEISGIGRKNLLQDAEKNLDAVQKKIKEINETISKGSKVVETSRGGRGGGIVKSVILTDEAKLAQDQLSSYQEQEIDLLGKINKLKEAGDKFDITSVGREKELKKEIDELTKQRSELVIVAGDENKYRLEYRKLTDDIVAKTEYLAKLQKSSKELAEEEKKIAEEKAKAAMEAQKYQLLWKDGAPPEHRDIKGERAEAVRLQDEAEEKLLKDEEDRLIIEQEIAKLQQENMNSIINSVGRLQGLFGDAGDQFIQKLQIALQMVQAIQAIQARTGTEKEEGVGLADIVNIAMLLVGLFDKGGYTGAGSRNEPAGIVHRGEIVFEKPIVDKYGDKLMALRSSLKGYAGGGKVDSINTDSFAMISNNSLLNEVRALRQQNAMLNETMKRVGDNPIVIQANLDAIKFLKKYKPEYDKFEAKKKV